MAGAAGRIARRRFGEALFRFVDLFLAEFGAIRVGLARLFRRLARRTSSVSIRAIKSLRLAAWLASVFSLACSAASAPRAMPIDCWRAATRPRARPLIAPRLQSGGEIGLLPPDRFAQRHQVLEIAGERLGLRAQFGQDGAEQHRGANRAQPSSGSASSAGGGLRPMRCRAASTSISTPRRLSSERRIALSLPLSVSSRLWLSATFASASSILFLASISAEISFGAVVTVGKYLVLDLFFPRLGLGESVPQALKIMALRFKIGGFLVSGRRGIRRGRRLGARRRREAQEGAGEEAAKRPRPALPRLFPAAPHRRPLRRIVPRQLKEAMRAGNGGEGARFSERAALPHHNFGDQRRKAESVGLDWRSRAGSCPCVASEARRGGAVCRRANIRRGQRRGKGRPENKD